MKKFDVDIERTVDAARLGWPESGEANADRNLGCNRSYLDLRGISWKEAREALQYEEELLHKVDTATPDQLSDEFWDEMWEDRGEYLYGLDLGVASTTFVLSAARCIPFSSCNGGCCEDGHHHEAYPVVAFFARPAWVPALIEAAEEADVGLNDNDGTLVVYADDIWKMVAFAHAVSKRSAAFGRLKLSPIVNPDADDSGGQLKLRFEDLEA